MKISCENVLVPFAIGTKVILIYRASKLIGMEKLYKKGVNGSYYQEYTEIARYRDIWKLEETFVKEYNIAIGGICSTFDKYLNTEEREEYDYSEYEREFYSGEDKAYVYDLTDRAQAEFTLECLNEKIEKEYERQNMLNGF